jgi:hypothetical protein
VQTTENVGVGREEAELDGRRTRGWPEQRQRDDVHQIMAHTGLTASDTHGHEDMKNGSRGVAADGKEWS